MPSICVWSCENIFKVGSAFGMILPELMHCRNHDPGTIGFMVLNCAHWGEERSRGILEEDVTVTHLAFPGFLCVGWTAG